MKTSLIIADNHPLFRNGVRQIVDESGLFHVVAEVGDGEACLQQVLDLKPTNLILDLNLPGMSGFEVVRELRRRGTMCRIVILSMHSSQEFVTYAREMGCQGFVAKEDAGQQLIEILTASNAKFVTSSAAGSGEQALEVDSLDHALGSVQADLSRLTPTELEILNAVAATLTSQQIGELKGISERTVHSHRQNICKKFDLSGPNSLIKFAIENKHAIKARLGGPTNAQ